MVSEGVSCFVGHDRNSVTWVSRCSLAYFVDTPEAQLLSVVAAWTMMKREDRVEFCKYFHLDLDSMFDVPGSLIFRGYVQTCGRLSASIRMQCMAEVSRILLPRELRRYETCG